MTGVQTCALPISGVLQHVSNASLSTLRSSLDTTLLSFFFNLVELASNGSVTCLDALHSNCMPGSPGFGDGSMCVAFGADLGTRHLDRPVACAASVPGHYVFLYADHGKKTIFLFDPLGHAHAYMRVALSFNSWLTAERTRLKRNAVPAYDIVTNPMDLPLQNDGMSCGVYTCAYLYFKIFHQRWPTTADFKSNHYDIRLALFDACTTGRLRQPLNYDLQYAGAHAAGGAVAGADNFFSVSSATLLGASLINVSAIDVAQQQAILDSITAMRVDVDKRSRGGIFHQSSIKKTLAAVHRDVDVGTPHAVIVATNEPMIAVRSMPEIVARRDLFSEPRISVITRQLLSEENVRIDNALLDGDDAEDLGTAGFNLLRGECRRLLPSGWLNDSIMNLYFQLLGRRHRSFMELRKTSRNAHTSVGPMPPEILPIHLFSTYFWPVLNQVCHCCRVLSMTFV